MCDQVLGSSEISAIEKLAKLIGSPNRSQSKLKTSRRSELKLLLPGEGPLHAMMTMTGRQQLSGSNQPPAHS